MKLKYVILLISFIIAAAVTWYCNPTRNALVEVRVIGQWSPDDFIAVATADRHATVSYPYVVVETTDTHERLTIRAYTVSGTNGATFYVRRKILRSL